MRPADAVACSRGLLLCLVALAACAAARADVVPAAVEPRIDALLRQMTLEEKIGQLAQVNADEGKLSADLRAAVRAGKVGSVLNAVDVATVNELQRVATQESRLGIPLLVGRDVIHGFRTVLPIPLGQAASWNPGLVRAGRTHGRARGSGRRASTGPSRR